MPTVLAESLTPIAAKVAVPNPSSADAPKFTKPELTADLPPLGAQNDWETKITTLTNEMGEALVAVVDPAADTPTARADLNIAPTVRGATESAGTGIASSAASMKKTENVNKVAGLDAQFLPSSTPDTARDAALPARSLTHATTTSPAPERAETNFHFALPTMAAPTGDVSRTAENFILPTLNEAGLRTVERTHEMVSLHALRLIESQADSLQVVIKPGGGTELSLELRHRNGTLEAAAILQSGDYQLLNQHWPELQQKLEQRGIKLAPLGSEAGFGTPDQGNFSRRQPSPKQSAQQASAFAEFTVAAKRGGATARMAPVAMANEWWA